MNKLNKINKLKQNKRKNRDEFPSLPLTQGGFEGEQTEAGKWCSAARGCCCAIWPLTQNLAKEDVCPERGRDRHRDAPHPLPGSPAMRSRGGLVLKPCSCGGVRQGVVCASDQHAYAAVPPTPGFHRPGMRRGHGSGSSHHCPWIRRQHFASLFHKFEPCWSRGLTPQGVTLPYGTQ